jgi:hypothetical protein
MRCWPDLPISAHWSLLSVHLQQTTGHILLNLPDAAKTIKLYESSFASMLFVRKSKVKSTALAGGTGEPDAPTMPFNNSFGNIKA